ncbi:MAG: class I SAM-dependent DNA methyltransferase [Polyangia bacterium]
MTAPGDTGDPYAALALVYDDWQARYGSFSAAVLARLLPALDAEVPPVASFFEAGCGTGTLLLELAARRPGWRLAGADVSAAMLACARAKPGAGRIGWHASALGAPIPTAPFDAAGCFFNTLNHLGSVSELRAAFAAFAAALRPSGLLLFDVNNRTGYERWWHQRNVYEGPGWQMQSEARFDGSRNEAQALLMVNRDGATAEVLLRQRLFEDAEITAALADSGLRPISREPWSPTPDGAPGSTLWMARSIPPSDFHA